MNGQKVFYQLMNEQTEIALASSVKNQPNVRIVNFLYSKEKGCLFFTTFNDNQKISEFNKNNQVAFTTIPTNGIAHVRVHQAIVKKSQLTVFDLEEQWVQKIPSYQENIHRAGNMLELFEIQFNQAVVILDMNQMTTITLE